MWPRKKAWRKAKASGKRVLHKAPDAGSLEETKEIIRWEEWFKAAGMAKQWQVLKSTCKTSQELLGWAKMFELNRLEEISKSKAVEQGPEPVNVAKLLAERNGFHANGSTTGAKADEGWTDLAAVDVLPSEETAATEEDVDWKAVGELVDEELED